MLTRKQSTSSYPIVFFLADSTDHISPATGKTVTVTLSKNGGSFASAAGAVSEIGNGWYSLAANSTDRDTIGELVLHATATGADNADLKCLIVPFDPFDATALGLTNIDAAVSTRLSTAGYTAPSNSDITAIKAKTDSLNFDGIYVQSTAATGTNVLLSRLSSSRATNLDNLDATVSSRLASASYTAPANSDIAAIKVKTDQLTFNGSYVYSTGLPIAGGSSLTAADVWSHGSRSLTSSVDINNSALITGIAADTQILLTRLTETRASNLDGLPASIVGLDNGILDIQNTLLALDVPVSTRLASSTYTAPNNAAITGTQANVDILTSRLTSSRAGYLDYLDTSISSRLAGVSYTAPDNSSITSIKTKTDQLQFTNNAVIATGTLTAAAVWDYADRQLTAATTIVVPEIFVNTSGDVTKLLERITTGRASNLDYLDTSISTRMASASYVAPDNVSIAAIKNKTDSLNFNGQYVISSGLTSNSILTTADIWANGTRTLTGPVDINNTSEITSTNTNVSTLLSRITSTRAGNLDYLDVSVNSRLATAGYTAPDNASITAIKTKTDQLTFDADGVVASADLLNMVVDAGYTVQDVLSIAAAILVGKRGGGGTNTLTFKGLDNTTVRVTMSQDNDGNSTDNPVLNP